MLRVTLVIVKLLMLLMLPTIGLRTEAQCRSPNNFQLGSFAKPPSLAIRLFGVKFRPEFPVRQLQGFRIRLAEKLREQLLKSRFFSGVTILADDVEATAELILTGELTEVVVGTNSFSWYNIVTNGSDDQSSWMALSGTISPRSSDMPATTFECLVGYDRGTARGKVEESITHIAKYLKGVYAEMAQPHKKGPRK